MTFWCKRFALAFVVAFVVLAFVRVFKGNPVEAAVMFALAWGAISASVFTLAGYIRYRRNPACMLPRDGMGSRDRG
jgi:NADH:ubiquinone oxidoreductase subunit 4 (subunit M)